MRLLVAAQSERHRLLLSAREQLMRIGMDIEGRARGFLKAIEIRLGSARGILKAIGIRLGPARMSACGILKTIGIRLGPARVGARFHGFRAFR